MIEPKVKPKEWGLNSVRKEALLEVCTYVKRNADNLFLEGKLSGWPLSSSFVVSIVKDGFRGRGDSESSLSKLSLHSGDSFFKLGLLQWNAQVVIAVTLSIRDSILGLG